MPNLVPTGILFFLLALTVQADRPPARSDPGGVLPQLNFAAFSGSSTTSIQATATDASGNVYVAGTTTSPDFLTTHAAQPKFGEASILRTTDLGATWSRVGTPSDPNVNIVVPDPVIPQILYAAAFTGIYKTTDGGQTWLLSYPLRTSYTSNQALVIDPANHLRVAAINSSGALIRSVDGGATWTAGASCGSLGCDQLVADPAGSGVLLSVSLYGFYLSRDWGLTFQLLTPPGGSGSTAAFDPSHPGWIYADTSEGVMGTLSLSMDFGATWTAKASPPSVFSAITNLAVDPDQPNALVAVTVNGLYTSLDGAASWTLQSGPTASFVPENYLPFVILPRSCASSGGLFAIGGDQQVAFSPDYGQTWPTPQLTQVLSVAAGPGCAVYVTRKKSSDAFVAKLAPGGATLWSTYLGGSDQDTAVALALDSQGNLYVTGDTVSPDFPVTLPRIGTVGSNSLFVTKYAPDGHVEFSVLIGGASTNYASAIALDPSGQAVYIGGNTTSQNFPVTSGVLFTTLARNSSAGFVAKLSTSGALLASSYLGVSGSTIGTYLSALLVDASGNIIIAGSGAAPGLLPPLSTYPAFIAKLDPAITSALLSTYLPSSNYQAPAFLALDAQGNLLVFGAGANLAPTSGAYSSPPSQSSCGTNLNGYDNAAGSAYLTKLAALNWTPVYTAVLQAPCGIQPGAIAFDPTGAPVLALATGAGLPLRNPFLAGPTCSVNSSAIAKLSLDGSSLLFATYLDACGIPALAAASDGIVYLGVAPSPPVRQAGVLRLKIPAAPAFSLDGIGNAFSGDANTIVGGGLYSLTGTGFHFPAIDLGLNANQTLPDALGGVQVRIDGVPAPLLHTGSDRIIVAIPAQPSIGRSRSAGRGFRLVQIVANGAASNAVWMPESNALPGLLTVDFPNPPSPTATVDGIVRNQDGTLNSLANPAAAGSTITVFTTGMGAANSPVNPGAIATSPAVVPITPIYSNWQSTGPGLNTPAEIVNSVPGFVSAMFQVQVQVPASLHGTAVGNGVTQALLGLQFSLSDELVLPVSNVIAVYVK